ncbi:MAG: hypothetical protein AAF921_09095 [Cyanobacteria bacterium P01_D01_bin.44]
MNIELSQEDLLQMPPNLASGLLNWLQYQRLKPITLSQTGAADNDDQLKLELLEPVNQSSTNSPIELQKASKRTHIRLSQLLDAGITKPEMAVRVRLKAEIAHKTGYRYFTRNLKISTQGTVIYNGQEFNKPSPLAESINGSSANGWEYVEVKKDGRWVCLDELRQIWRKVL